MNIYLYGSDTFRSRQRLQEMIVKFKKERDPQGMNVVKLDCSVMESSEIIEQIMAIPFLTEKRMVILENLMSSSDNKDVQTSVYKRFEEKTIPEKTILIFWEGKNKAKTNIAKKMHTFLKKEKYAQEFLELKNYELKNWIKNEVEKYDVMISFQAIQYIVLHVGNDMWRLHSLIEQLVSYTSKEINISDVELFLDKKSDDNIFNLVDAIISGQTKKAYSMIRQQYEQGENAMYILSMLIRQFRILLQLRDFYDRNENVQSTLVAQQLKLHPYVVKKSLPFIKKYNSDVLKKIFKKLREIDIKTKTGQGNQKMLLDVFVGAISFH